ncbi:Lcl C-terminal domain-containing protein [Bradyrhizobium liaoningense]
MKRFTYMLTVFALAGIAAAPAQAAPRAAKFTKLAANGTILQDRAPLGDRPGDWACTRDEQTGLTWEVKTTDGGLRDGSYTYTPYDSNPAADGSAVGYRDSHSGRCLRSAMTQSSCNTEAYVKALNRIALCGFTDWRLPKVAELVNTAAAPAAASPWFPNSVAGWYWTGASGIGQAAYSRVILLPAGARANFYDGSYLLRLVRGPAAGAR